MGRPRKVKPFPLVVTAVLSHTDDYGVPYSPNKCVLAEELREKYPRLTNVRVYRKTISWTDRETGDRYLHATPPKYFNWLTRWDPYAKALADGTRPLPKKPPMAAVKLLTANAKITPAAEQKKKNDAISREFRRKGLTARPKGQQHSLTR